MAADGSIIIDTKIDDSGMSKGFQRIKNKMGDVTAKAKKMGNDIQGAFSNASFSKPVEMAKIKVESLERQLAAVTAQFKTAVYDNDDKKAEKLDMRRVAVYEQLRTARQKLAIEVATAAKKQAAAEEAAAKREIKANTQKYGVLTKSANRFGIRLSQIISSAFVFNVISRGLTQVTKYFGTALKSNDAFSRSLAKLKGALLTAFQPIYDVVTPVLTTIINLLTRAAQAVGQFFAILTGKNYSDIAKSAESLYDTAEGIGAVGKESKKSLAPFDEIHTLSNEGLADSGGSGTNVTPDFSVDGDITDGISPKIQTIVDKITSLLQPLKEIDLAPTVTAFNNLKKALEPITTTLFAGLEWAWNNILVPLAGWTIENAIPAFFYALEGALNVVNAVLEAVKPLLQWLWTSFLQPIAEWTGGVIVDVLTAIGDGLTVVSDWISEHQALVEGIAIVVGAFAAAWVLVNGAITLWNTIGVIATGITTAFGVAVNFLTSPIGIVVVAIGALIAIVVLLAKNWDTIKAKTIEIWNKIKTFLINLWNSIKAKATSIWNAVKTFFSNAWNSIKNTATKVWNGIKSFFVNTWNGIKNTATKVWNGVKTFFSNTWNSIKSKASATWNNVKTGFSNAWTTVKTKTSAVWNSVKSSLTNTWNNIKTKASATWTNVKNGFSTAWTNVKNKTSQIWGNTKTFLTNTWNNVKTKAANTWNNVKTGFTNAWSNVKNKTNQVWGGIKSTLSNTWGSIKTTASNAWNSVKNGAISAWNKLKTRTSEIWNNIVSVIKKPINSIIGAINGFISGIISGINSVVSALNSISVTVPSWVPYYGGRSFGFNLGYLTAPQIPYLAQGAVIPPNAPFMAMLGDQKRGTNIEAPLATIEQALRNVLTEGNNEITLNVNFTGNLSQLARILKPEIDAESQRKGYSLAKVVVNG